MVDNSKLNADLRTAVVFRVISAPERGSSELLSQPYKFNMIPTLPRNARKFRASTDGSMNHAVLLPRTSTDDYPRFIAFSFLAHQFFSQLARAAPLNGSFAAIDKLSSLKQCWIRSSEARIRSSSLRRSLSLSEKFRIYKP